MPGPYPGGDNSVAPADWTLGDVKALVAQILEGGVGGADPLVPWEDASPYFINGATDYGSGYGPSKFAIYAGCLWLALTLNPGTDGQVANFDVAVHRTIVAGFADGGPFNVEVLESGIVDFFGDPTATAFVNAVIPLA